jgi:hypothetical protein
MAKKQKIQGYHRFSVTIDKNNIDSLPSTAVLPPSPPNPNNIISLHTNIKTDEEIISNSNYKGLDLNLLLNSTKTRRAKRLQKCGIGNPPRPQNSFFLYMRSKISQPEYQKQHSKDRSKAIAKRWKEEPKEVRDLFEICARVAKKKHAEQYEDYQYKRKPSKNKQKSMDSNKTDIPQTQYI